MKFTLKPNLRCAYTNDLGETTGFWDVIIMKDGEEIGFIEVKEQKDYKSYWLEATKAEVNVDEDIKDLLIEKAEEAVEKEEAIEIKIN